MSESLPSELGLSTEKPTKWPDVFMSFIIVFGAINLAFGAIFLVDYHIHKWRWSDKYATGFGQMQADNIRSTLNLCNTFMSEKMLPYLDKETIKGWSDLCLDRVNEMVENNK
jgi:hypothetical protein